jgi:uncharacterized membrane protein YecN with MAPEG domain
MIYPQVTALYTGLFAAILVALSIHVVSLRARLGVHHGDGNKPFLNRAIRAHGNFTEYVPLILLMAALLEGRGTSQETIHGLLGPLLLARLMHPVGMHQPIGSVGQYAWRASSTTITWIVLSAAAILLCWTGL